MAKQKIRPITVDGDIAYVPLNKGYVAIIDAEDVPLVEGHNWCVSIISGSRTAYAYTAMAVDGKRRTTMLHRLITNAEKGFQIDHRDHNGLNNRKTDLRQCTNQQNQYNRQNNLGNSSPYKGVSWHNRDKKFRAQIRINKKKKHLGYFDTAEEAHEAYCKASQEFHGEFGFTG